MRGERRGGGRGTCERRERLRSPTPATAHHCWSAVPPGGLDESESLGDSGSVIAVGSGRLLSEPMIMMAVGSESW
eukprot:521356-Rhodomonas_salina.1